MLKKKQIFLYLSIPILHHSMYCLFDANSSFEKNLDQLFDAYHHVLNFSLPHNNDYLVYECLSASWLRADIPLEELGIQNGMRVKIY